MPVREVNIPKMNNGFDPKTVDDEGVTDIAGIRQTAKNLQAMTELEMARKQYESVKNPTPPVQPEPAIKIGGEVNFGKFDLMAQQQMMNDKVKEIEDKFGAQMSELNDKAEDYRERLHGLQLEKMQEKFDLQVKTLMDQLSAGRLQNGSFTEELEKIKMVATSLGFQPAGSSTSKDPAVELQIIKLNADIAREAREFDWKMKQDERVWEVKKKELESNNFFNIQKLQLEKNRNDWLASLPEMIGTTFARGLMSGPVPEGPAVASQPAAANRAPVAGDKPQSVEAGEGEAGELACPKCGAVIAIGPTTTEAVCSGCNYRLPVRRRPASVEQSVA